MIKSTKIVILIAFLLIIISSSSGCVNQDHESEDGANSNENEDLEEGYWEDEDQNGED